MAAALFLNVFKLDIPLHLLVDLLRRELVIKQEVDVVLARLAGILEIHRPMGLQEIIVIQRAILIPAQLVVDLPPCIIDRGPEAVALSRVKLIIAVERGEVDEPVLQQLKV